MKAIVYECYGGPEVLHLEDIEKPSPKDNELLIRVHAASVNFGDLIARRFKYVKRTEFSMLGLFYYISKLAFGLRKPRIKVLGSEFSGVVESIGSSVKMYKPGDEVFGFSGQRMGAYAEYIVIREKSSLAIKPSRLSFEECAVSPYGGLMALPLLRRASIKPGQRVLINGASGAIGSAAVQIAKSLGAEVTGVCSAQNMEWVKKLGANYVIDYKKEDFTLKKNLYDLIFDIQGKLSYKRCKKLLTQNGKMLYVSFKTGKQIHSVFNSRIICTLAPANNADMHEVKKLLDSGLLRTELDKIFPMEQATEAHRYVEEKKAKGKVAICINPKL